jgi:D-amino-acid dehydrogenase
MRVAVLGAGVIGVTTAYYLAERRHSVTVFDRAAGVAAETSFANGAQLSYSYTDAMARPEFVQKIPGLMLGLDPAVRVRTLGNFALFPWGLHFLAQCTTARARENTLAVLKTALRSRDLMAQLQQRLELNFSHRQAGKLVLLADEAALAGARQRAEMKRSCGCETRVLTPADAIHREPALAAIDQAFAGAVYSDSDEVGDPLDFSVQLARWLVENRQVDLRLSEEVTGICSKRNRLTGIRTGQGELQFDAVVVCMGPWSATLLKPLGINPHICPVRGYSITLPAGERAPSVSITSLKHRMVFSRVGELVRIAGFADFLGSDTSRDEQRVTTLLNTALDFAPLAADYGARDKHPWGGFRAMTPSGRPLVGTTRMPGLFVNVGHGMLGWTLACATGHDVASAVSVNTVVSYPRVPS